MSPYCASALAKNRIKLPDRIVRASSSMGEGDDDLLTSDSFRKVGRRRWPAAVELVGNTRLNHQSFFDSKIGRRSTEVDVPVEDRAPFPKKIPRTALYVEAFQQAIIAQLGPRG